MKLNLFSSDGLLDGYLNVDIWIPPNAKFLENFNQEDLSKPWPWEDSSIDEVRAHDGPEHLASKIHFMNEAHRVLKPGGILDLFVPTTDGRGAFQDPTHVSFWTPNDLFYYVQDFAEWIRFHEAYGITARFRVADCDGPQAVDSWRNIMRGHREYVNHVWKLKTRLEAVK